MPHLVDHFSIKTRLLIGAALLFAFFSPNLLAADPDKVRTYKDSNGWKLKVNNEDFYVKGVVWGYTPRDENYQFNLWGLPDEEIRNVLDHDFSLMKQAGINAIRAFSTIPPKWVVYINKQYGIKTAINPLMGRYGETIGGKWVTNVDYSDPLTRETLKRNVLNDIEKYKNVPGVLMFALGNESNYGLSWSSFEIENLPVGEQQTKKAEYLYSLYGEIIQAGQQIDPDHPITIVNGDIQYIDLISKYSKGWGLLGVNAYRGKTFTELWKDVKSGPDLPVVFFEFGSDAFNARDFVEDQAGQASYLKSQWLDMYNNSHGRGYGNSIGGFVFEWRDEWWKYKQTENLDKHDRNASWENGGYKFDHVPGQNNMNEEWFGIVRLGDINADGVYIAEPRLAYDVLTEVWKIDPYAAAHTDINGRFDAIDMGALATTSSERDARNGWGQAPKAFEFTGGEVRIDFLTKGYDEIHPSEVAVNPEEVRDQRESDWGQMAFFDFAFQPSANFRGDFTINVFGDAADSDFEFRYGDRINDENDPHVELYDFQATYTGDAFDLNAFYHVPRYHWGYKGDFFGLLRETTDMDGANGQDIWNAKAPYGLEFVGKQTLDGLTIVGGPEIYWGANPKVMLKYQFGKGKQYTFMHSEDISEASGGESSPTSTASSKRRQTTLQGEFDLNDRTKLEIGGIISGTRKIDDEYEYLDGGQVKVDEIEFEDTLGLKAKVTYDLFDNARAYAAFNYAGLVADGGAPLIEFGTELPYAERGNKKEFDAGVMITHGNYMIFPRVLYRDNIIDANPLVAPYIVGTTLYPGIEPRNTNDEPFAVWDNREARSAEIYLTYDPTPATPFYEWDNDEREDATFAYNIGLTATSYRTATDSALFHYEPAEMDLPFGLGLPAEDVWLLKSKMVFNPNPNFKAIVKAELGKQQPTGVPFERGGSPVKATKYGSLEGKFIFNREHIVSASFVKDGWGIYDFQREFNVKYPEQVAIKYTWLLDKYRSEKKSTQFGVKAFYRTLDEYSAEYAGGLNDYMYEFQTYFSYKF